jgi:hypothetical protein
VAEDHSTNNEKTTRPKVEGMNLVVFSVYLTTTRPHIHNHRSPFEGRRGEEQERERERPVAELGFSTS